MQYIVTEEEMSSYCLKSDLDVAKKGSDMLRRIALDASGVSCINDKIVGAASNGGRITYCEECPVGKALLAMDRGMSESMRDYSARRDAICPLPKRYSK